MTDQFELLLALLQREMCVDDWILAGELKDLCSVEIVSESAVDFSRELRWQVVSDTFAYEA